MMKIILVVLWLCIYFSPTSWQSRKMRYFIKQLFKFHWAKNEIQILPPSPHLQTMNSCISKKVLINILNFWGFVRAFCFGFFTYRMACVVCVQGKPSQKIKQFEKITKHQKNPSKFKLSSEHIRSHLHLVSKTS